MADITVATEDGQHLQARLYAPTQAGQYPALVAVHGGGWQRNNLDYYRHWGPWLASHGYVVLAVTHRLSTDQHPGFPTAIKDVQSAVRHVRANAEELSVDSDRIALMGDSSGAHLVSLAALAGPRWDASGAQVSADVKAVVCVYGIFDLVRQWQHDLVARPRDPICQRLLGVSLLDDRRAYFDASPLSYVSARSNAVSFLLAWGDADTTVDGQAQSAVFLQALRQAGHFARELIIPGAAHFWIGDALDEPHSNSAVLAPALLRFLRARL